MEINFWVLFGKHVPQSISDAVGDWFYDRSGFQVIDKRGLPRWCVMDPSEPNPTNNYNTNE